jgi:CYTH domain-containing protein
MAKEIERKFLLTNDFSFPFVGSSLIKQGYIFSEKGKQIRIRLYKDKAILCLKYGSGLVRDEYEYEVPFKDGIEIYKKCTTTLEKFRNTKVIGKEHYDFDTYPNGIEIVEVEFKSENDMNKWVKPKFIGREITGMKKYSNIILAKENLKF